MNAHQTAGKTLKTIIFGGSNSVIKNGYLENMTRVCRNHGVEIEVLQDCSVGNTTIGYGLYQAKLHQNIKECDVIIIEYALNDEFIYSTQMWNLQHWARLYEGLIRWAKEQNPNILIYSVILAARIGDYTKKVPLITASIAYISDWYGVDYIDISRITNERFGAMVARHEQFYMPNDSAHYANPTITAVIGEIIALGLIEALEKTRDKSYKPIPVPIDNEHYADSSIINLPTLVAGLNQEPQIFNNWRFNIKTVDIAQQKIILTIEDGKLLGIKYACIKNTGPLYIQIEDKNFRAGTMKFGVQDHTYKFLISWLPCEFLHGEHLLSKNKGTIQYSLSGKKPEDQLTINHTPRDGCPINQEQLEDQNSFLISGILYSGKLVSIEYIAVNAKLAI